MPRQRKLSQSREHLSIRLDPHVEYAFSRYAQWAGVTRCELGRMVVEQAVARFKAHGRTWVRSQVAAHTTKTKEDAGATDGGSCAETGCNVGRHDEAPTMTMRGEGHP